MRFRGSRSRANRLRVPLPVLFDALLRNCFNGIVAVQVHGRNNHMARYGLQGVFATEATRAPRDVRGQTLPVRFEIVDKRAAATVNSGRFDGAPKSARGPYTVAVSLQVGPAE